MIRLPFVYDDGGRQAAGYRGYAGDCVARSICIATGRPYKEVYDRLAHGNATQRRSTRQRHKKPRSARNGINTDRQWFKDYMVELGFRWIATAMVGQVTRVHLRADELPATGTLVVKVSRHYTTVVDGVLRDTHDPSRDGTRMVCGYWEKIT